MKANKSPKFTNQKGYFSRMSSKQSFHCRSRNDSTIRDRREKMEHCKTQKYNKESTGIRSRCKSQNLKFEEPIDLTKFFEGMLRLKNQKPKHLSIPTIFKQSIRKKFMNQILLRGCLRRRAIQIEKVKESSFTNLPIMTNQWRFINEINQDFKQTIGGYIKVSPAASARGLYFGKLISKQFIKLSAPSFFRQKIQYSQSCKIQQLKTFQGRRNATKKLEKVNVHLKDSQMYTEGTKNRIETKRSTRLDFIFNSKLCLLNTKSLSKQFKTNIEDVKDSTKNSQIITDVLSDSAQIKPPAPIKRRRPQKALSSENKHSVNSLKRVDRDRTLKVKNKSLPKVSSKTLASKKNSRLLRYKKGPQLDNISHLVSPEILRRQKRIEQYIPNGIKAKYSKKNGDILSFLGQKIMNY